MPGGADAVGAHDAIAVDRQTRVPQGAVIRQPGVESRAIHLKRKRNPWRRQHRGDHFGFADPSPRRHVGSLSVFWLR
jgi:hypothetical protein